MTRSTAVVVGGAGFIGSHLVDRLLSRGERVTVIDRAITRNLETAARDPRFAFVAGDVRGSTSIAPAFDANVATVFHLAAIVGVHRYLADPVSVIDTNVAGLRNVVEAARSCRARVVFASTSEIYGKNPKVPWAEDDDRVLGSTDVARWAYGSSKGVGEHLLLGMHHATGVPATIVRLFNVYGPRQSPHFVVSRSIHRCLRGEPPLIYDDGAQTRCFTYVADAIEGMIRAADEPAANGQVFNIGSDRESAVRDVIDLVIRAVGLEGLTPVRISARDHLGSGYEEIPRRVPDVRKAKRLLGWEATTSLADGIARTVEWARDHRWWLVLPEASPA